MLHKSKVAEFATLVVNVRLKKMQPLRDLTLVSYKCNDLKTSNINRGAVTDIGRHVV